MFTIHHYRRLIVNCGRRLDKLLDGWWLDWEMKLLHLSEADAVYYRKWIRWGVLSINHPLVNSGDAYWLDDRTLCLGYKLRSNNDIYRPIFSHIRQDSINKFQENIKKTVLKREETAAWYEFVRIKKLPIDIVDKVIEYRGGNLDVVLGLKS